MFEKFEKLIFKLVRGVLLVFAFFAFVGLIGSAVLVVTSLPKLFKDEKTVSVKVNYKEVESEVQKARGQSVKEEVQQSEDVTQAQGPSSKEEGKKSGKAGQVQIKDSKQDKLSNHIAKIMKALQEKYKEDAIYYYQKDKVENALRNVLSQIPERNLDSFVDGMIDIIKNAKEEDVFIYMNTYIQLYWNKYNQEVNRVVTEKAKAKNNILAYLGTIVSTVMILILAGIVLILTAIERNTRPHEKIE